MKESVKLYSEVRNSSKICRDQSNQPEMVLRRLKKLQVLRKLITKRKSNMHIEGLDIDEY